MLPHTFAPSTLASMLPLLLLTSFPAVFGRSWQDVLITPDGGTSTESPAPLVDITPADPFRSLESEALMETDPLEYSRSPSSAPSESPTQSPSSTPSSIPSQLPTGMPSDIPSGAPSLSPSSSPSEVLSSMPSELPSLAPSISLQPSSQPTIDWTIEATNPVPPQNELPKGYFNYDPNNSKFGPNGGWAKIKVQTTERKYWEEFKEYLRTDLNDNKCEKGKKTKMQSPIDVRVDGIGKNNAECLQYHEFRHKQGIYPMADPDLKKQIHPTKLRLKYPRRPPGVEDGRTVKGPPSADVPKGWGYQLDVVHIDFKVPSEHWMEGKQYLGEYQIYIIQKKGRGVPAVSVLMDYHPQDEDNAALQVALDAFQDEFDANTRACGGRDWGWRERRAQEKNNVTAGSDRPTEDSLLFPPSTDKGRDLAKRGTLRPDLPWDPWHPLLVPTVWFFGYEGSITEPPCSEFVEWHVFTEPMLISQRQLRQMKELLVNQVDSDCRRTSTSYHGSVARPIQNLEGRAMYKCNCRDFISDDDRKWYGRNRCWEGDEYVFHPDEFPNPTAQERAATP